MHRLRLQMGLPGISEKEKIAAHIFWREMAKLFYAENETPLHGYPDDFDGLVKFCEDFENTPRPKPERTNLITTAIYEQFVFRFFPKDLHWLGHQLLRSMALPTTLETAQIDPPYPMAKEVLPKLIGLVMWHQETQMDDPERSYIEERDALPTEEKKEIKAAINALDKAFPAFYAPKYKDDPKFAGCPLHMALGQYEATADQEDVPEELQEIEAAAGVLGKQ